MIWDFLKNLLINEKYSVLWHFDVLKKVLAAKITMVAQNNLTNHIDLHGKNDVGDKNGSGWIGNIYNMISMI